jgi:hypothetical protein
MDNSGDNVMTNIDIAYLGLSVAFILSVAFFVTSIIQIKINREQRKINKVMADYIHALNEVFDRIDVSPHPDNGEFMADLEEMPHENGKNKWFDPDDNKWFDPDDYYLPYNREYGDYAKRKTDNVIKKTDSLSPNPDPTQTILAAFALSNIFE